MMELTPPTPDSPPPPPLAAPTPVPASHQRILSPWPKRWEYALAFILGICVVIMVQSAWKLLQAPEPLQLTAGQIDLNQADINTLKQLPGVGAGLAARIVDHRSKHGPFQRVDDLKAVHGVGPTTLERLRTIVTVSLHGNQSESVAPSPQSSRSTAKAAPGELIDLNHATREQLMSLPGIGPALADRILEERSAQGDFNTVQDLGRIRGIKAKTIEKIAPFVKVIKLEKGA
jgi:competence ComEA-like helix-hairpin-helix protein